jgi:hypothetical protein
MFKKAHLYFLALLIWLSGLAMMIAFLSGNKALEKLCAGVGIFSICALPICIWIAESRRAARRGAQK